MLENSVFDRTTTSDKLISASLYNVIIGLTLLYGFIINWYLVTNVSTEYLASINIWLFLGAYFVSCILGIFLFNGSDNPIVSFIGYNLVVVPFGLVLNLFLHDKSPELIRQALEITALVTVVMMIAGSLFPAFFQKIGTALFISLLACIIIELVLIFVFKRDLALMDWIVALIFCGYIGFDWSRANMIPKTVDNAIDSAAALYMDIINLFVRIVSILGNSND